MKRQYIKPKSVIHLQAQFHLLTGSSEEDGVRVNMSGYRKSSSSDGDDDGWD